MSAAVADATRARLLTVAGPLFAANGYRDTGVAEICAAAGCNVAAINYHFGGKLAFYAAVLEHVHRNRFAGRPMPQPTADAPADFAAWVDWWIRCLLDPTQPQWPHTLLARAMVDAGDALDAIARHSVKPMHDHLCELVRRLLGRRATKTRVLACAASVIGQVLHYKHARPMLERLAVMPDLNHGLDELIDHVVAFSLAGIAAAGTTRPARRSR